MVRPYRRRLVTAVGGFRKSDIYSHELFSIVFSLVKLNKFHPSFHIFRRQTRGLTNERANCQSLRLSNRNIEEGDVFTGKCSRNRDLFFCARVDFIGLIATRHAS